MLFPVLSLQMELNTFNIFCDGLTEMAACASLRVSQEQFILTKWIYVSRYVKD